MVGIAVLNITGRDESYVFQGDRYIRYQWTPGTTKDKITYGPTETHKEWASLEEAGFGWIDAILPIPGHDHRAYFFCGDKYVRIEYVPGAPGDKILGGVHPISDWPSLVKAGFSSIDGALPVPGKPDEVYFFSGQQYCRTKYTEGKIQDELLDGPKPITTGWSALGFDSIDTVFPRPGTDRGAYFFNGGEYCQLNVVVDGKDEHVSGPREIASFWPGLAEAGFY